ncbi:uncharacterized protein MYCFIDRAFT_195876 [Pseudocercospora fijiensis CIRAD86]|uniref:Uncharacterized protein n=1 Tax=Pseudocercospora fijiensis (strain CIRAD86) TaxID=383855 RepID=M2Z584_PSEFD|nr:uncharacterized protein MYCFIDRAFT_195876 [Pseudocercospora fijiensis CIRAD86]EME84975.1 hypothetical protein MYCFIDRAFT_195876 [Pseudocercospora fijiensis CIRAD86]
MASIEKSDTPTAALPDIDDENALDPANSERQYHRHPHTGLQREIWRPGDGDGNQRTEYFDRGHPVPADQRWRIFQSEIGEISWVKENFPPRFVWLDDRAAFEVSKSDIPKAKIQQWWPHDFGSPCKIRKHRVHIGRPAIKDDSAEGDARYEGVQLAGKAGTYYFTGQKDFEPVIYKKTRKREPTEEEISRKRKAEELLLEEQEERKANPRARGHNQYTARNQMVKYGAPSQIKKPAKAHNLPALPRANSQMRSTNAPFFVEKRLIGGIQDQARDSVAHEAKKAAAVAARSGSEDSTQAPAYDRKSDVPSAVLARSQLHESAAATNNDDLPVSEPRAVSPVRDVDVPRQMGYIERRATVQKVAAQIINTVQNQEDVKRLTNELADEKVKAGQQAKELEKLKQQLEISDSAIEEMKKATEGDQTMVAQFEVVLDEKEQEIESLKAQLLAEKQEKVQLELKVDAHEATIEALQDGLR